MQITDQTKQKNLKRISQVIGGLSFLMLAAAVIIALLNIDTFVKQVEVDFGYVLIIFSINAFVSIVLALLVISRHPDHVLGLLFLAIGFLFSWFSIAFTVGGLYDMNFEAIPGLIRPVIIIGGLLYLLPLMIALGLIPLYFPNGRLLSPRWRPVLVVVWIGIIGQSVTQALSDMLEEIPRLATPGAERILDNLLDISGFILILGILGALASLVVRFFRSRGDERTRMKWLVYTAVMSISIMLLMSVFLGEDSLILGIFSSALPLYLTVAIGIAILRHRLFDIDIIIRRTLQYAILTAVLGLVYFVGIVVLQIIFSALAGQSNSPLITVISTLIIAALFNPLRIRIQDFIDRRFYRQKYDSEQTLARFSAASRDEVDLEALASAMLGAVDDSLQPELVSLWLRPVGRKNISRDS